jgi:hypothetical protein
MGFVDRNNVHDVVSYHAPDENGLSAIQLVREATESYIMVLLNVCPESADRSVAIRHARDAMMNANASIVLKGTI